MGRLIDADRLVKRIEDYNSDAIERFLVKYTKEILAVQPTVIAVPMKQIGSMKAELREYCDKGNSFEFTKGILCALAVIDKYCGDGTDDN